MLDFSFLCVLLVGGQMKAQFTECECLPQYIGGSANVLMAEK